VASDARLVNSQDAGPITLFTSPSYNAAGQLTAASIAVDPSNQQPMIGLARTYDLSLRPVSESDSGQVGTPGTPATLTVAVSGTEQSIGSGTPVAATGTVSLSYAGGEQGMLRAQPLLVSSSITLPNGYHTSFVASATSAVGTANAIANALNQVTSPVTAVVASGGTASAASVTLTSKVTGASQNGTITVHLVATQVTAAPASMSGGSGATYDTGTVTATVGSTNFTVNYGQTSTSTMVASALASAITAGQLGVTATTGANGALTVTANAPGTTDNGMTVTLNSSTSEPSLFSSPSFSGTSGSLGGGTDATQTPGTIYSYSIPSPPTANTGYDGVGNVRSFTDLVNGQWTQIGYDTLNRLTTATVAGTPSTTYTWSYDAFGNRRTQGPNGGTVNYPPGNNRIEGYNYNADGSISDDNNPYGYQYGYDGEGRVCVVYNKTMATWTGYAYDGLGNRVAKGTALNSLNCDNNFTASSTYIVGQNGELLDLLDASGAVYSNVFANGHLLATYQFPTSQSQTPEWTYALNDWLGTKRFVADSNGEMFETCTGLPFGDGLNCQGPGGDPSPLHFTGKERDSESGNDYFGARYYQSTMGRFLTPDWSAKLAAVPYAKLENPQTLNLYSYVGNNPLSAVDPDGHQNTPGGTQCGQTVSIACSDPQDEAAGELKASEAEYVAQLQQAQQQSSSSGGGGFWSSLGRGLGNLLHGRHWGYVKSTVSAETDNSNLKVIGAKDPAVAYGTDAAGVAATLFKIPYVGPASALLNYANDPNARSAITNGISLLPGEGATWPTTLFVDGFDYGINHSDPNVQPWKGQPFTDGSAPGGNYGESTSGGGGASMTQFECKMTGDC